MSGLEIGIIVIAFVIVLSAYLYTQRKYDELGVAFVRLLKKYEKASKNDLRDPETGRFTSRKKKK